MSKCRSYDCDRCGAKDCTDVYEIKARHIRPVIKDKRGYKLIPHVNTAHICGDCYKKLGLWAAILEGKA